MTSKSKNKGKGFERDVCKILGKIYGDNFERVPHSGAFVGGVNAARKSTLTENQIKAFKGDIIPPDHWKHFNCECKMKTGDLNVIFFLEVFWKIL